MNQQQQQKNKTTDVIADFNFYPGSVAYMHVTANERIKVTIVKKVCHDSDIWYVVSGPKLLLETHGIQKNTFSVPVSSKHQGWGLAHPDELEPIYTEYEND